MKKKRENKFKELARGKYKEKKCYGGLKVLDVYVWKDGDVSISYEKNKIAYFVLPNPSRLKLIKLLQKKKKK